MTESQCEKAKVFVAVVCVTMGLFVGTCGGIILCTHPSKRADVNQTVRFSINGGRLYEGHFEQALDGSTPTHSRFILNTDWKLLDE